MKQAKNREKSCIFFPITEEKGCAYFMGLKKKNIIRYMYSLKFRFPMKAT